MATSLVCPECEAPLKLAKAPTPGKRVKCPNCDNIFDPADSLSETQGSSNANDTRDDQENQPRKTKAKGKKKKKKKPQEKNHVPAMIAGGVAALLVVVGLVIWLASGKRPEQKDVAATSAPEDTPTASAAPTPAPKRVEPVKPKVEDNTPPKPNTPPTTTPPATTSPTSLNPAPSTDALEKARKATVYVHVSSPGSPPTIPPSVSNGSGFVVRTSGDSAYIVTNYQVFQPGAVLPAAETTSRQVKPPKPSNPAPPPRPPVNPHPGVYHPHNLPHTHLPGTSAPPNRPPDVTVTFNRGQSDERTVTAEIAAFDEEADLAMLHVTGVSQLPAPIEMAADDTVKESSSINVFGFPDGTKTAVNAAGSIARVHTDQNKDLSDLQLNGDVSPGHTGGPVVDSQGRLVGVAVASTFGKNVDRAIPTVKINQLFSGKVSAALVAQYKAQAPAIVAVGETWLLDHFQKIHNPTPLHTPVNENKTKLNQFFVLALAADPLHKINNMNLLYGPVPATSLKQDQGWAPLLNAQKVTLAAGKRVLGKQHFSGTMHLQGLTANQTYAFQFSYVNADGVTLYTEPQNIKVH